MATYGTYDTIGQAEDVSDVISNISPEETLFTASIGTQNVSAVLFEWQEDSLVAVEDLAAIEGAAAADDTLTPTVMRNNRTQIIQGVVRVSGTVEAVKQYGRSNEGNYNLAKRGVELRRSLENALIGTGQAAVVGDATSVARKMAGHEPLIAAGVIEDASAAALTETLVLNVLKKVYDAGGSVRRMHIKPADATIVANFATATGRERDIGNTELIVNVVSRYISPYGSIDIFLNRRIKTDQALVYDPAFWKLAVLRNWMRTPLAKDGDSRRWQLLGEFSLMHLNFSASGLIDNLT